MDYSKSPPPSYYPQIPIHPTTYVRSYCSYLSLLSTYQIHKYKTYHPNETTKNKTEKLNQILSHKYYSLKSVTVSYLLYPFKYWEKIILILELHSLFLEALQIFLRLDRLETTYLHLDLFKYVLKSALLTCFCLYLYRHKLIHSDKI